METPAKTPKTFYVILDAPGERTFVRAAVKNLVLHRGEVCSDVTMYVTTPSASAAMAMTAQEAEDAARLLNDTRKAAGLAFVWEVCRFDRQE